MSSERSRALDFLAPGLLHRFGNTLFAVHGRARLLRAGLDETSPPLSLLAEDAQAVVDDADAAMRALSVLRWLAGAEPTEVVRFAAFVDDVLDVARVPLRDAAVVVHQDLPEELADAPIEPGAAIGPLCAVLATLRATGTGAETSLRLRGMRSGDFAELRFEREEGAEAGEGTAGGSPPPTLAIRLHDQP